MKIEKCAILNFTDQIGGKWKLPIINVIVVLVGLIKECNCMSQSPACTYSPLSSETLTFFMIMK